nr:aromatic ring-hydroxylating dioxygenase subunit alpha [Haloplanus sp.]
MSPDITDETNALPARYLTDPDVKMEKEKIFSRYWVYAGHANCVPDPGDYFTRAVGDKQVIVARDEDGAVRAFYDVCAHRGSRMVDDTPVTDPGNMGRIRCPSHLWTCNLNGDLQSTPRSFEETNLNPNLDDSSVSGVDPDENGLMEVTTDTIGPLTFLNFADDPPLSLAERAGTLQSRLESLPSAEYEHARRYVSEVECNSKTFGGNYSKCDHFEAAHREWITGIQLDESELEVNDYHRVLHYTDEADVEDELRIHDEHEAQFQYFWHSTLNTYGTADGYGTYIIDPIDESRFQLIADYHFADPDLSETDAEFIRTSRRLQEEEFELVERQYEALRSGALAQGQLGSNEHILHRFHRLAQEAYNA